MRLNSRNSTETKGKRSSFYWDLWLFRIMQISTRQMPPCRGGLFETQAHKGKQNPEVRGNANSWIQLCLKSAQSLVIWVAEFFFPCLIQFEKEILWRATNRVPNNVTNQLPTDLWQVLPPFKTQFPHLQNEGEYPCLPRGLQWGPSERLSVITL